MVSLIKEISNNIRYWWNPEKYSIFNDELYTKIECQASNLNSLTTYKLCVFPHSQPDDFYIYIPIKKEINKIFHFKTGNVKIDLSSTKIEEKDLQQTVTAESSFVQAGETTLWFVYFNNQILRGKDFIFNGSIGSNKFINGGHLIINNTSYKIHHCGTNYRDNNDISCKSIKFSDRTSKDFHIYVPVEKKLNKIYNFKSDYVKIDLSDLPSVNEENIAQQTIEAGTLIKAGNTELLFYPEEIDPKLGESISLKGSDFYFSNNQFGSDKVIKQVTVLGLATDTYNCHEEI